MVQKTYFKTKDYCKVKFTFAVENAIRRNIFSMLPLAPCVLVIRMDVCPACDVSLPKNTEHQFKYRVNENEWVNEPEADKEVTNEFGGINSVIVI